MGFWADLWGDIVECGKKAGDFVRDKVKQVVDGVKEGFQKVRELGSNIWASITGEKEFQEADRLYNAIKKRYDMKRKEFEEGSELIIAKIENAVLSINDHKSVIQNELLPTMADTLGKLKAVKLIEATYAVENYQRSDIAFSQLKSKDSIYTIDFNKNKFTSNLLAIFTLGFYTRKKAQETLRAVQEQESKINYEIAKMDAELTKLEGVLAALQNVEYYIAGMTSLFKQLLARGDHGVSHLYWRSLFNSHRLVAQDLHPKLLSKVQQEEIKALVTTGKILRAMNNLSSTSLEVSDLKVYEEAIKTSAHEFDQACCAA